jgi:hypothetical protein
MGRAGVRQRVARIVFNGLHGAGPEPDIDVDSGACGHLKGSVHQRASSSRAKAVNTGEALSERWYFRAS